MHVRLTIGEFSKMTYLSVKALRHYHDVGLLEPAAVDPATGYRLYDARQVATAQAIRRFRELDMPIDAVRAVLSAPDVASRDAVILDHLRRMEIQLARTQATVASLRDLLAGPPAAGAHPAVDYRALAPVAALAICDTVAFDQADVWFATVFDEVHAAAASAGMVPAGPDGALYFPEFFEDGNGDVLAFTPVDGVVAEPGGDGLPRGRVAPYEVPACAVAVMVHEGPFADLDRTYGALGTVVAERGIGTNGPIREHYLVTADHVDDPARHRTEVCWPITGDHR